MRVWLRRQPGQPTRTLGMWGIPRKFDFQTACRESVFATRKFALLYRAVLRDKLLKNSARFLAIEICSVIITKRATCLAALGQAVPITDVDARSHCLAQSDQAVAQRERFLAMSGDRQPRKKVRHYDNGEPHFLTFSCYRRLPLLSKDRTRQWVVDALQYARVKHGFHLWAWVIMPEHVHLLLWPPFHQISSDAKGMRGRIRGILSSIKRPVAERAIAYLTQHAPDYLRHLTVRNAQRIYHRFWQAGSGHDENVVEPAALHALVEYVHLNPVRRGLVQRPEDWPWSSFHDWEGWTETLLKVDRTLPAKLELPWTMRTN